MIPGFVSFNYLISSCFWNLSRQFFEMLPSYFLAFFCDYLTIGGSGAPPAHPAIEPYCKVLASTSILVQVTELLNLESLQIPNMNLCNLILQPYIKIYRNMFTVLFLDSPLAVSVNYYRQYGRGWQLINRRWGTMS